MTDDDARRGRWAALVAQARVDVQAGAGHACDEWRDTPDGRCALCDDPAPVRCRDYRPDHNGECLNCDEPASEHDL